MKTIQLTQGKATQVSDDWFAYLNQWKWQAQKKKNGKWYAVRQEGQWPHQKQVRMHRVITSAPNGMDVDHKDNDGLNNEPDNLRICTKSQNSINRTKRKNASGFRGVYPEGKRWQAKICVSGTYLNLHYYDTPDEAARVYDKAAREYHGEFAQLNFPDSI